MAMGVRATLVARKSLGANRGCRRPQAGAVGAVMVGTYFYIAIISASGTRRYSSASCTGRSRNNCVLLVTKSLCTFGHEIAVYFWSRFRCVLLVTILYRVPVSRTCISYLYMRTCILHLYTCTYVRVSRTLVPSTYLGVLPCVSTYLIPWYDTYLGSCISNFTRIIYGCAIVYIL
eukprot:SAG11_NODE_844_length_6891_cov_3.648704_3_plen_175_part_00